MKINIFTFYDNIDAKYPNARIFEYRSTDDYNNWELLLISKGSSLHIICGFGFEYSLATADERWQWF